MPAASNSCPLCGALLPASGSCQELYDELSLYTLTRGRQEFIHQHAVDAYAAQHATEHTKPIAVAAALIGLYLFAEHGYSGLEVQQAHMTLGNKMKNWPLLTIHRQKAKLNVADVLQAEAGLKRDQAIRDWTRAVWETWREHHEAIATWLKSHGFRLNRKD